MKKFTAVLLALIVVFSTSVVAFAAGSDVYTCPTCSMKYTEIADYNACIAKHSAPAEEESELYECATCHKKFEDVTEYNACVDSHFNNVNYHYDKYVNLTVIELLNSFIEMFNSTGIKELITSIFEKVSSLFSGMADSVVIPEIEA